MTMTKGEIRRAMQWRERRIEQLQRMGYPGDHPLIQLHRRNIVRLEAKLMRLMEVQS